MAKESSSRPVNNQVQVVVPNACSFVSVEMDHGFGPCLLSSPIVVVLDIARVDNCAFSVDQHPVDAVVIPVEVGFHGRWCSSFAMLRGDGDGTLPVGLSLGGQGWWDIDIQYANADHRFHATSLTRSGPGCGLVQLVSQAPANTSVQSLALVAPLAVSPEPL